MKSKPLHIAFLWHMHQPIYFDYRKKEAILPWTRLHALNDYLDLPLYCEEFPGIRMNFNLVPSLLFQLEKYIDNSIRDPFLEVGMKPAKDLTSGDRLFILRNFFSINRETRIYAFQRFRELLEKRGDNWQLFPERTSARFSDQDMRDLQTWFFMAWSGPFLRRDETIRELTAKGRNFSEEDKTALFERQNEWVKKIVPKYRELQESGRIEISTTPFSHPILPLVNDSRSAREALPGLALPDSLFHHPEDVERQLSKAVEYHANVFGKPPTGLWPSEGAVSDAILGAVRKQGFRWLAADQATLERSTLSRAAPGTGRHFRPWLLKDFESPAIFFRDRGLSDLIGFSYKNWDGKDAAADFLKKLAGLRTALPEDGRDYIAPIILDGENAWEHYRDGGVSFLSELFSGITEDPRFESITFGAFLEKSPPKRSISRLFAGSWIGGNFATWIGHTEKNRAWELLGTARNHLEQVVSWEEAMKLPTTHARRLAWESFFAAEGSDWFWWFGDDHYTAHADEFDQLFRNHLKNIYHFTDAKVPAVLNNPVRGHGIGRGYTLPMQFVTPAIDGGGSDYFEWSGSGLYIPTQGAMHSGSSLVKEMRFGFDLTHLYWRIDFAELWNCEMECSIRMLFDCAAAGEHYRLEIKLEPGDRTPGIRLKWGNRTLRTKARVAVGSILECAVPFSDFRADEGDLLEIVWTICGNDILLERHPVDGSFSLHVPGEDFEAENWFI